MAEKIFAAWNGPAPTTAGQVKVATGATIKTMLQLQTPSTMGLTIIEWGISFDGSAAATPVLVELCATGSAAATVTAFASGDITRYNQVGQGSLITLGTTASGYTASSEGTVTVTDMFDAQLIAPSSSYVKQFPLGREPDIDLSTNLRIRVTAPATVNALCYIIWSE